MEIKTRLKNFFHKRRIIRWSVFFAILLLLFVFRFSIMRGMAGVLVSVDEPQKVEACFVLGGSSYERGLFAVKMFEKGYADKFICTGENVPSILEALGQAMTEAEVTAFYMRSAGIPDSSLAVINKSTSTREEAKVIREYCESNGLKKVMLLSSKFHTARMRKVFRSEFRSSSVEWIIVGAPSTKYNEFKWWESEEGMIALNNEWMKTIWYWFK
ncbi:MAG TPA: hypothetical protein DEP18_09500 [Flavobacteriales bacterium]|nr:hypothetical protein [Flavobacteriales bacterium]HCA84013.1 hypothetical protein [Flavobacteriales bacterium]